jgi:hypothetical protein
MEMGASQTPRKKSEVDYETLLEDHGEQTLCIHGHAYAPENVGQEDNQAYSAKTGQEPIHRQRIFPKAAIQTVGKSDIRT